MAKNGSTPKPQNRNPEITKGPNGYSSSSSYQPTNIHDIRWFNRWKRNSGQGYYQNYGIAQEEYYFLTLPGQIEYI